MTQPSKPRALTYTEMMNGGRQQLEQEEHIVSRTCSKSSTSFSALSITDRYDNKARLLRFTHQMQDQEPDAT